MKVQVEGQEFLGTQITVHAPPVEYIRSYSAMKPDPRWRYVDPAGHRHRWHDTALPTLRELYARVRYDGTCGDSGCEGSVRTLYACRECAAWVQPRYVADSVARTTGTPVQVGLGWVEIEIEGMWPSDKRDGLRVEVLGQSLIGTMTEWEIEQDEGGWVRSRFTVRAPLPDAS